MTNKIKCIIVDDEPLARDVLEGYAKQIDQLEVVAICANAVEAFGHLQKQEIDLVFLDIKMPKINGLELLESLNPTPLVVFTTAYREFAIKAFELDAIDYLLKPISLSRFMKTISKANKYLCGGNGHVHTETPNESPVSNSTKEEPELLYIKTQRKIVKLDLSDISYLESLNDKVIIHTSKSEIPTTQRIGYLAEKLPKTHFIRIHRSFIVSLDKVTAFNSIMVEVHGKELPIGRNYRSHALEVLQRQSS
ncbi:LytR/AlgR family response regulator transcription factor [Flagellimonas myxillae]|uniref:LytR/AlgR family response regulator transcription factor n=1 Tax=Flagellimonas myxillae TaxID=2942214 RepID=UPI00201ED95A|nr:LytTR family DNA-binding domain-containing protein [Muricauda myxillae]MCL6268256.1 LytTR family DNA-binding domain-containing protein [Muricauda myxillae]